jgi:hypothetical protein
LGSSFPSGTSAAYPFDTTDNRFERLYGFQRPWSANGYIVFENLSNPKVRLELRPARGLRVELSYSWTFLASASDRFGRTNAGVGTSRDYTKRGGKNIGMEFDTRVRYPLTKTMDLTIGYAHFEAGFYLQKNVLTSGLTQAPKTASDFAFAEISQHFF